MTTIENHRYQFIIDELILYIIWAIPSYGGLDVYHHLNGGAFIGNHVSLYTIDFINGANFYRL